MREHGERNEATPDSFCADGYRNEGGVLESLMVLTVRCHIAVFYREYLLLYALTVRTFHLFRIFSWWELALLHPILVYILVCSCHYTKVD